MSHPYDPQCCTSDEDGNPDVCLGPPKEEPDCYTCGDTGRRNGRRCPSCDPNRWHLFRALVRWRLYRITRALRAWTGRESQDEAPF